METKTKNGAEAKVEEPRALTEIVELPKINANTFWMTIVGDSSLLLHKFSLHSQEAIESKQQGKAVQTKGKRVPVDEYEAATPRDIKGRVCIPAVALKLASIEALSSINKGSARGTASVTKVLGKQVFHVLTDGDPDGIPIGYVERVMDTRRVNLPNGSADIRYRPRFDQWWCHFAINFDANSITQEQIMNMVMTAGFGVGIGDLRPGKTGAGMGRFHLADESEIDGILELERGGTCEGVSLLSGRTK